MDGIHDLGGMQGFGPVPRKGGDAPFRDLEEWEKRMWAMTRYDLAPGTTIDWFRHGIERMVPADYLGFAYFNKWCANMFMLMLDGGGITMNDVVRGHIENPSPSARSASLGKALEIAKTENRSFETEASTQASFSVGQSVHTKRRAGDGHTRLPRYARDRQGTIIVYHGCHVLPDEGAKGREVGDHLYTVSFTAAELWGPDADPRDSVTLDLWESYLVSA